MYNTAPSKLDFTRGSRNMFVTTEFIFTYDYIFLFFCQLNILPTKGLSVMYNKDTTLVYNQDNQLHLYIR